MKATSPTYIPELAKADPELVRDLRSPPPTATSTRSATARQPLHDPVDLEAVRLRPGARGPGVDARARRKVGVEPTGDAFNSISLEPSTGRPLNPMINAGAIATTSLVAGGAGGEASGAPARRVLSALRRPPAAIDEAVYESESETGHRNRAIGHMLRNFDILTEDPTGALDLYFRQCSIAVDCRDLALMAATLANGGVNPLTGERAVRSEYVDRVLSVMTTCGMYDFAGEWVYRRRHAGQERRRAAASSRCCRASSGIGVFSPRARRARQQRARHPRAARTSRASSACTRCASRARRGSPSAPCYNLAEVRSKRLRREPERRLLDDLGVRAKVFELQGALSFSAAELAVRRIVAASASFDRVIVTSTGSSGSIRPRRSLSAVCSRIWAAATSRWCSWACETTARSSAP